MRFIFLFMSIFLATINAEIIQKSITDRVTKPEDTGMIHTEAFEMLAEMHSIKRPTDREELLKNSLLIMTSLCDAEDADCMLLVSDATLREFQRSEQGTPRSVTLNHDQVPALVEPLERMVTIVKELDEHDLDDVLSNLEVLRQEVEELDEKEIHDAYKWTFLSALSIATESAKLWNKVYRDPSHVLYGMHTPSYYEDGDKKEFGEGRQLQDGYDIAGLVIEDVMGGLYAGVDLVMDDITAIANNLQGILLATIAAAIPASISAFFEAGGGGGGSGNYGYNGGGGNGYNYGSDYDGSICDTIAFPVICN